MMDFRKVNALTQSIYLVRFEILPEKSKQPKKLLFHILGNSQRVYKVHFPKGQPIKCSCPDHCMRKVNCKHIFFVTTKILKIEPEEWILVTDIDNVANKVGDLLPHLTDIQVSENVSSQYVKFITGKHQETDDSEVTIIIRNTDCCICLCDIDLEDENGKLTVKNKNDVVVCSTCRNGIHVICWDKWSSINGSRTCVYCRSTIKDKSNLSGMEKDEWGIKIL